MTVSEVTRGGLSPEYLLCLVHRLAMIPLNLKLPVMHCEDMLFFFFLFCDCNCNFFTGKAVIDKVGGIKRSNLGDHCQATFNLKFFLGGVAEILLKT